MTVTDSAVRAPESAVFDGLTPPYRTLVVDPPWRYATKGITTTAKTERTRPDSSAQYSTLSIEELCALPVAALAGADAHLYLWATNPLLFEARALLDAWGFRYVTLITWLKTGAMGMGYYFRGDTEHVLFGVRGKAPIPPERRQRNWLKAAKHGHSVKPAAFFDLVEASSDGPYVELFARQPRLGWDSWGYGHEEAGGWLSERASRRAGDSRD